jgi:hypothetical protein
LFWQLEVQELDGGGEIWVPLGIEDDRRLDDVPGAFHVDPRPIYRQPLDPFQIPKTPEQNFKSVKKIRHSIMSQKIYLTYLPLAAKGGTSKNEAFFFGFKNTGIKTITLGPLYRSRRPQIKTSSLEMNPLKRSLSKNHNYAKRISVWGLLP